MNKFDVLISLAAVSLVAGFIGLLAVSVYLWSPSQAPGEASASRPNSTTIMDIQPESSVPQTTITPEVQETTSIPDLPLIEVHLSQGPFYTGRRITINVSDQSQPVAKADVYLDEMKVGETASDGLYQLEPDSSGYHDLKVSFPTFRQYQTTLHVSDPPSNTQERMVDRMLTVAEREAWIAGGGVSLQFYDSPNCANCRLLKPRLEEIAEDNDCILYERISLWRYHDELAARFHGFETPIVIIEGERTYQTTGLVSTRDIKNMLNKAASDCKIS